MGTITRIKEVIDRVDHIEPIARKEGAVYVTFEDAAVLNDYYSMEPQGTGNKVYNRDGSVASTGKTVHALNPDFFFSNRYRKKGAKLHVVAGNTVEGYRCIKEQATGHVYLKSIPCYVIFRNGNGDLELEKVMTVSSAEFVSEFTSMLDNKSMAEILPLIVDHGAEITADSMPI